VQKSAAGGRVHQPTPVREVRDTTFAGPAGDVPVRVYVPTPEGAPPQAGVVYFHGGAGPDSSLTFMHLHFSGAEVLTAGGSRRRVFQREFGHT